MAVESCQAFSVFRGSSVVAGRAPVQSTTVCWCTCRVKPRPKSRSYLSSYLLIYARFCPLSTTRRVQALASCFQRLARKNLDVSTVRTCASSRTEVRLAFVLRCCACDSPARPSVVGWVSCYLRLALCAQAGCVCGVCFAERCAALGLASTVHRNSRRTPRAPAVSCTAHDRPTFAPRTAHTRATEPPRHASHTSAFHHAGS